MREHAFVRTPGAIYRVFGRYHPPGRMLLLLRYYRAQGQWCKPPVFAAEVLSGDLLECYDLPLHPVQHYAITLGLGATEERSYLEYFDPLAEAHRAVVHDFTSVANLPDGTIGVTGSRLVGLATDVSDLDLVIYGPDGPTIGADILRQTSMSHELAAGLSSTMQKLRALNAVPVPRENERNIFKGALQQGDSVRKLDLHYAATAGDPDSELLPSSHRLTERQLSFTVIDVSRRHLFPGHVTARASTGGEHRVWINDHVLSLLLPGDTFHALCTAVLVEPHDTVQYVAQTITDVTLR